MRESAAAAAEFRKIIDHKGATWGPRYEQAYVGLARAALQIGDSERAKQAYSEFLALWKNAEADIALLIEEEVPVLTDGLRRHWCAARRVESDGVGAARRGGPDAGRRFAIRDADPCKGSWA